MKQNKYPTNKTNTADATIRRLIDEFKQQGDGANVLKSDIEDYHYICANKTTGSAILLSEYGFFFGGIKVVEFDLSEVDKVKLCIVPKNISNKLFEPRDTVATAASAGAMLGGIGGLVIGAAVGGILEDVYHPRTTYGAELTIEIRNSGKYRFDYLTHLVAHQKSNHHDYIQYVKQEYLPKINRLLEFTNTNFGEKVKLSCW